MIVLGRRLGREVPPGPRRYELAHWIKTALPLAIVDSFFIHALPRQLRRRCNVFSRWNRRDGRARRARR
jgi:hypothetical protein